MYGRNWIFKSMRKLIAFLLCLFFGFFGIHRFFLKYYKSGLLMLGVYIFALFTHNKIQTLSAILFGVICIWWLVDLIIILYGGLKINLYNEAHKRAQQQADNMIDSMKIVTKGSGGQKSTLGSMREAGIKLVELICFQSCPCCAHLKNAEIPIDKAPELPMKDCPLEKCFGRYGAIVKF